MYVFVAELEDEDTDGHAVLTGRFCVHDEGEPREVGSLSAAIEWARGAADHVEVEFEDVRYSAAGAPAFPPLGPEQHARAALGRRRWPGEEWLDRTELDDPVLWLVRVELHPPDDREAPQPILSAAESALEDEGFVEVWSSDDDDTHLVHATIAATTWRSAARLAVSVVQEVLPDPNWRDTTSLPLHEAGWGVKATARPVASDPPRSPPV